MKRYLQNEADAQPYKQPKPQYNGTWMHGINNERKSENNQKWSLECWLLFIWIQMKWNLKKPIKCNKTKSSQCREQQFPQKEEEKTPKYF